MSLKDFRPLGNGISIYGPGLQEGPKPVCHNGKDYSSNAGDKTDQPALIILCTWLGGATHKRIQTYTLGYHKIWPKSSILLIRTTAAEYAISGVTSLREKLRPAQRVIRRIIERSAGPQDFSWSEDESAGKAEYPGILLHMFSNGGANIATQLIATMNGISSILGKPAPFPLRQVVLDSCPGDLNINNTYAAASHSIPTTHPLRPLARAALYLVVVVIAGLEAVGLRRCMGKTIREQLNDPSVVSPDACRLYLTSKGDAIVGCREVLTHRDQALARGMTAVTVIFRRAGHCCLVLEDDVAYWGAIESCWVREEIESPQSWTRHESTAKDELGPVAGESGSSLFQVRSRL